MTKDYLYVLKVIKNKDNNICHYPALKNLISIWKIKWKHKSKGRYFNVYLHSLNTTLKRSFQ
jgi:hypothetical protein